jgi:DNA polymerase-3 subunit beta
MKVTVSRRELHEAMGVVGRAVSTHTSLPVLRNVLLEAGEDGLKLAATDLELSIEMRLPATVQEPGSVTVPARRIAEVVSSLPEADVVLGADSDHRLRVTCRRSDFSLSGVSSEEFPPMPEVAGQISFRLPQGVLKRMVRQTVVAASDDDTRPILTGVLFSFQDGEMRMVATDTHRLAVVTRTRESLEKEGEASVTLPAVGEDAQLIVPARALRELLRVLDESAAEPVEVQADQNQARFHTPRLTLVSRLIEGQFPRYQRVIPTEWTRRLTIPREELQSALRRVRIMARDAPAKDRVLFEARDDRLVLSAVADDGRAVDDLEVAREGEEIAIAFNGTFFLELLEVLDGEGLFLELTEPLSPAVARPIEQDDYLMVVMPMQPE